MKKEIFKVGDRVYCIAFGWGDIKEIMNDNEKYPIKVDFMCGGYHFTSDGRFHELYAKCLSFTEYTLQGFAQERPITLIEVGELCLVSDNSKDWIFENFAFIRYYDGWKYYMNNGVSYKYIKRIKILD